MTMCAFMVSLALVGSACFFLWLTHNAYSLSVCPAHYTARPSPTVRALCGVLVIPPADTYSSPRLLLRVYGVRVIRYRRSVCHLLILCFPSLIQVPSVSGCKQRGTGTVPTTLHWRNSRPVCRRRVV